MDFITVSAKTLDDAITEALIQLGVTSDNLDYVVIEKGSAGFLGIGMKQAVIKARKKVQEPEVKEVVEPTVKEEKVEKHVKHDKKEKTVKHDKKASGDQITVVYVSEIGKAELRKMTLVEYEELIKKVLG